MDSYPFINTGDVKEALVTLQEMVKFYVSLIDEARQLQGLPISREPGGLTEKDIYEAIRIIENHRNGKLLRDGLDKAPSEKEMKMVQISAYAQWKYPDEVASMNIERLAELEIATDPKRKRY